MQPTFPPPPRPLSSRAQAILDRAEQEVERARRPDVPASAAAHGLGRPRPASASPSTPAPVGAAPAPAASDEGASGDELLALIDALAQRTEVARRQLEELTGALDLLTRQLAEPAAPAPAPAVRWPATPG